MLRGFKGILEGASGVGWLEKKLDCALAGSVTVTENIVSSNLRGFSKCLLFGRRSVKKLILKASSHFLNIPFFVF